MTDLTQLGSLLFWPPPIETGEMVKQTETGHIQSITDVPGVSVGFVESYILEDTPSQYLVAIILQDIDKDVCFFVGTSRDNRLTADEDLEGLMETGLLCGPLIIANTEIPNKLDSGAISSSQDYFKAFVHLAEVQLGATRTKSGGGEWNSMTQLIKEAIETASRRFPQEAMNNGAIKTACCNVSYGKHVYTIGSLLAIETRLPREKPGAVIEVIITDAPIVTFQCNVVARKVAAGRLDKSTPSQIATEFVIVVSTGNRVPRRANAAIPVEMITDYTPLIQAALAQSFT